MVEGEGREVGRLEGCTYKATGKRAHDTVA